MLEKQIIPINFSAGVDTKTDVKLVQSPKLTLLENGIFVSARKIRKRNGYDALGNTILGGSTITNPHALNVFEDEINLYANNELYTYSSINDQWIDKGTHYSVSADDIEVVRNSASQSQIDIAFNQNTLVFAWKDSRGSVRMTALDKVSRAQYLSDFQVSASAATRVLTVNVSGFVFIIYDKGGANLFAKRYDPLNPTTLGAELTLATDLNAGTNQIVAETYGLNAIIAYQTGGTEVGIKYLMPSGDIGAPILGLPSPITVAENPEFSLCVIPNAVSGNFFVVWHNAANGLRYTVIRSDFSVLLAITTIDNNATEVKRITGAIASVNSAKIFYEKTAAATYNHFVKTAVANTAGAVSGVATLLKGLGLYSKAYIFNNDVYFNGVFDDTVSSAQLQATIFTFKSDGKLLAKYVPTQSGGLHAVSTFLSSVMNIATNQYAFSIQKKTKLVVDNGTFFTLTGVSEGVINYDPLNNYLASTLGGNYHIVGGFMAMYDGQSVVEHGFHYYPFGVTAVQGAAGSIAAGTYLVYATYEWIDNRGQIHRSATSTPVSVTIAASKKIDITVPTLRLTAKQSTRTAVKVTLYRTEASGVIAYKIGTVDNDPTADTVSFTDDTTDAVLVTNEILYTMGGALGNFPAPSCTAIEAYKRRIFIVTTDKLTLWYSKEWRKGEGVSFAEEFTQQVNPLGGDITVLKMLDDKLIIFKKNHIFVTAGDGPTDNGLNNDLREPELVTSDAGCIDPNSAVFMPRGIMFKSQKGIYLLDRSLQLTYIGADVEAYNSQTITSADLIESSNQVRFLTNSGLTLLYDYYFNEWSTFTNHEGLDAVVWQGTYTYLRNNGKVFTESATSFKDENQEFRLRIGTAWIKLAGVQGYQRVRRVALIGDYKSQHILRMKIGYDYESYYANTILFSASSLIDINLYGDGSTYGSDVVYGGIQDNVYQFRAHMPRQKCESIRFLFEDVTAGTPGEAYSLADLSLEVGIKRGLNKLKQGKTIG